MRVKKVVDSILEWYKTLNKKRQFWLKFGAYIIAAYLLFLILVPLAKFNVPYSTVVLDSNEEIIGARIADDMQWRFPNASNDSIPEKLRTCIINFEDRYFPYHFGVNPYATLRALFLNVKLGKVVSGGSTISMQVIRLSRKNPPRTYAEKLLETAMAMRLECSRSKDEILQMYLQHAPYGGNIVGMKAASWRYYGKSPNQLSWGESATLAVLPNAPALIYPGHNQRSLEAKRNRLLNTLLTRDVIDSLTYRLACSEPMPESISKFPNITPHLTEKIRRENSGGAIVKTSIEKKIQLDALRVVNSHFNELKGNHINNMSALVVNTQTGEVKAYIANTNDKNKSYNNYVDMIHAERSSGSILKPFLYAKMLEKGQILPKSLLRDVPVNFKDYSPKNYLETYDGAVPANEALYKSLNIPFVTGLKQYGVDEFLSVLRKAGVTTLDRSADDYGLSLILGGGEVSLWEMCGLYASMARELSLYGATRKYSKQMYFMPKLVPSAIGDTSFSDVPFNFDAGAVWNTFDAMKMLKRPNTERGWQYLSDSREIAWKTGTSFGYRDAWAIGVTPKYVVGVWVGNANGIGRPGLTGTYAAAPVMFDIFGKLPSSEWFQKPVMALRTVQTCKQSGMLKGPNCEEWEEQEIPAIIKEPKVCKYHKVLHLDESGQWQVNANCYSPARMVHQKWFVLPPVMEWYYRRSHPEYKVLPPVMPNCVAGQNAPTFNLIYPEKSIDIYVPKSFNNEPTKVVFKAGHQNSDAIIYWHVDNTFIGSTQKIHDMAFSPSPGRHLLTLVDNSGHSIKRYFTVVE